MTDKRCHSWLRTVPSVSQRAARKAGDMATNDVEGSGRPNDPWVLTTPPGSSEFEAYRDPEANPPALVVQVGATELRYHLRAIDDLHAMLKQHGDWMALGVADEQKEAK